VSYKLGREDPLPALSQSVSSTVWREAAVECTRLVAEETPVALVYDATTEAVMMASPADLEDFTIGFSLNEGLISRPDDIIRLDIVSGELGVEARLWLKHDRGQAIAARRRSRTGPTGCGLCGIDSLQEVVRGRGRIESDFTVTPSDIQAALSGLEAGQSLGAETRAVHAAGLWQAGRAVLVREDVGRHNALDKLAGAVARAGTDTKASAVVLTSRISVEMVQKTIAMGVPILIAVSAPTGLALRLADEAGLTIVAVARADGFEVFTHARRVKGQF
jgi:FdhD protein